MRLIPVPALVVTVTGTKLSSAAHPNIVNHQHLNDARRQARRDHCVATANPVVPESASWTSGNSNKGGAPAAINLTIEIVTRLLEDLDRLHQFCAEPLQECQRNGLVFPVRQHLFDLVVRTFDRRNDREENEEVDALAELGEEAMGGQLEAAKLKKTSAFKITEDLVAGIGLANGPSVLEVLETAVQCMRSHAPAAPNDNKEVARIRMEDDGESRWIIGVGWLQLDPADPCTE